MGAQITRDVLREMPQKSKKIGVCFVTAPMLVFANG
jgi:hypothetical protein